MTDLKSLCGTGQRIKGDERIFVDRDFGCAVSNASQDELERNTEYHPKGFDFDGLVDHVGKLLGAEVEEVL